MSFAFTFYTTRSNISLKLVNEPPVKRVYLLIEPIEPNGFSHPYPFDQSNFVLRDVGWYFSFLSKQWRPCSDAASFLELLIAEVRSCGTKNT